MLKAFFGAEGLFPSFKCFPIFVGWLFRGGGGRGFRGDFKASSEALRLLQEAGLGGQRHEGRGQASKAHPGAEVEVRGGE